MPNVKYNGQVVKFPDGMSEDSMRQALTGLDKPDPARGAGTPSPGVIPAIPTTQELHFPDEPGAQPARATLALASKAGVSPDWASANKKETEGSFLRDSLMPQMQGLPKLAQWGSQSDHHAAAISDDIDNLGVVDYFLGRGHQEPFAGNTPEEIAANKAGKGRYVEDTPPGWLLNYGRWSYNALSNFQDYFESHFGTPDVERMKREQEIGQTKLPGEDKPAGKILYGAQDVVQGVAPYMLNPALAYGMTYVQNTGSVYRQLRLNGWEHEESEGIAELTGFTSASVMAAFGGRLFGSLIPKGMLTASMSTVESSMLRAVSSNPGFWGFMYKAGVNQAYAALMNAGMAGTESAIVHAAAAYKYGEKVPYSKIADDVWKAVAGSFQLLPLSAFAAAKGVSHERLMYGFGEPLRAENKASARSIDEELQIFDNFERAGLSLRSIHEAGNLASAVEAVKNSKFMQDNPRQGQLMIRSLSDPFKRQSAYVNPDVLMKMDPETRATLGATNVEEAYHSGSLVRVPMEKFLTHPDASSMLRDTATSLDLLTPKEAKLKDWAEWANTEQPPPGAPARKGKRPDEMLGFKGDLGQDRLNWWAASQVKERTIGDYDSLVNLHGNNERAARTNKENKEAQAKEALARASGKAQEGTQHGVQGVKEAGTNPREKVPGGFTDISEVSQGMMEDLATTRMKAREQFKAGEEERKTAEDKGLLGTKEEIKAGDYSKEAAQFERVEKINAAMKRQLSKAREEATRLKSKIEAFDAPTTRRDLYHGGVEYGAAYDALLESLGGKQRGQPAVDLNEVKEKIKSDNGVSSFDPDELNKLLDSPKSLDDMTLEEATKVHDALDEIRKNGLAQTQLRFADDVRDRINFVNGIREHLQNLPPRPVGQNGKPITPEALGNWGAIKQWFAGAKSEFLQPFTLFQMLGEGGDRMWFDGFIPALTREERLHEEIMPDLKKIEESLPKDVRDSFKDRVVPFQAKGREPLGVAVRSDVLRLMLHMGTQSGVEKIAKGFDIDPASLMAWAQANIARTPEHSDVLMKDLIEPMWRTFDKLWAQYEAQDFNGRPPPEKLKPVKVTVNEKEYQGGYGGWLHTVSQGKKLAVPGSMEELMGWHQTGQMATGQMHLQERTDAGVYPDLSWSGVASSISREIHDLSFYDFVRAMKFTFDDPKVRQLVAEKFGQQNLDQIYKPGAEETSWLHVLARGKVSDVSSAGWFTRGVAAVNGVAAMQAFSLNARVLAMQLSHIPANAFGQGVLNPIHIADASAKAFNPDRRAFAHTVSQVLPFREHDFARHNMDLITAYTGIKQYDNVLTKMNWSMWQQADGFLSHAIWEMGVNHALGKGASTQDAYRAGDRAVEAGMPVQTIYQQSAFVRDRSWVGLSFLVRNFPNTLANMGMMQAWNAKVESKSWLNYANDQASGPRSSWSIALSAPKFGPYTKAGLSYLGMTASAEILGKWLGGHGPKDEDKWSWLAQRGVASLGYPFMLGDVGEAGVHLLQGNKRGAMQALGHLQSPMVGETTRIANDFYDGVTKDDYKSIRAMLDLLGVASRTPIPRLSDWAAAFNEDNLQDALATGAGYKK